MPQARLQRLAQCLWVGGTTASHPRPKCCCSSGVKVHMSVKLHISGTPVAGLGLIGALLGHYSCSRTHGPTRSLAISKHGRDLMLLPERFAMPSAPQQQAIPDGESMQRLVTRAGCARAHWSSPQITAKLEYVKTHDCRPEPAKRNDLLPAGLLGSRKQTEAKQALTGVHLPFQSNPLCCDWDLCASLS